MMSSRALPAVVVALLAGLAPARAAQAVNFSFAQWSSVGPASGWSFDAGDFTHDGRVDVVAYHPSNGSVWVGRNTGSNTFVFTQWATVGPASGWTFWAGDFTGDGWIDVAAYHPSNGSVWVGRNTGSNTFVFTQWASVGPASGWSFWAGDFTGDGRMDVGAYHPSNGSVWVGRNTGSNTFTFAQWATVGPPAGWTFFTGDFSRDGRVDIGAYYSGDGSVWVGTNTLSSFTWASWRVLGPAADWTVMGGRFSGAPYPDLAAYHPSNGSVWVGRNAVSGFFVERWGTVSPSAGWVMVPGDFSGDGRTDLLAYYPGNGSVWVGTNLGQPPEGYAWPLSGAPGDTLQFMASGAALGTVDFLRHRSTGATVSSVVMGSATFTPTVQPLGDKPWRNGAGWSSSFSLTIPPTWPSGIYSARLRSAAGAPDHHITFVVKPSPTARSGLAVLANSNTWLAYNGWGGQSKYSGAAQTSYLRPDPDASPVGESFAHHHQTRAELWILTWLEDHGYHPDVYTDIDFHDGIPNYPRLVFGTHPEYWSSQMYDHLESYLAGGGKVYYLGGNGVYEQGVYNAARDGMTFLNGVEGGPREVAMFRNLAVPRHERHVLGVATERCGVIGSAFQVLLPGHFAMAGTGLAAGGTFGATGLNTGGGSFSGAASAWEVDTSAGPGAVGMGCSAGSSPPSTLPAGLQVIARGQSTAGGIGGEMTYYDHPGGGFVFTAGSLTFGGAIPGDANIQRILTNVLAH